MDKRLEQFVIKEMCPSRCGHLRFKLEKVFLKALKKERKKIIKELTFDNYYIPPQIMKKFRKAQKEQYEKGFADGSELTGRIAKEEHAIDVANKLKDQREDIEKEHLMNISKRAGQEFYAEWKKKYRESILNQLDTELQYATKDKETLERIKNILNLIKSDI